MIQNIMIFISSLTQAKLISSQLLPGYSKIKYEKIIMCYEENRVRVSITILNTL